MIQIMRRRYTAEFKAQAVGMVMEGKPVPEVARELGIDACNIYRWTSELTKAGAQLGSEGLGAVGAEPVADELRALRRENARLRMDNDILKKAAVILASYPPDNAGR
jgi:transposase